MSPERTSTTHVRRCLLLFVLLLFALPLAAQDAQPFDLLIRGGRVVDGAGNPWVRADIAVRGDRIARIGHLPGRGRRARHRRRGTGGGARVHRSAHARGTRHLRRADGGQLPAARRHDADRGKRRQLAVADRRAPRADRGDRHQSELGSLRRPGDDPPQRHGERRPRPDAGRARPDADARRRGDGRGRLRAVDRPVLRPGQLHVDRGSHRALGGRGGIRRHVHLAHARRGAAAARLGARDDPDRRGSRHPGADDPPQGDQPRHVGPERRQPGPGGRGACARGRHHHRSVSLHRLADGNHGGGAAVGAGGRDAGADRRGCRTPRRGGAYARKSPTASSTTAAAATPRTSSSGSARGIGRWRARALPTSSRSAESR